MPLEFTSESKAEVEAILSRYPVKAAGLLPVLHVVQQQEGHLSPEGVKLAAEACEVPPIRASEVATFYTMYYHGEAPAHHLEVCTNISCELRGAMAVFKQLRRAFECDSAGWSPDRKVRVSQCECMGSCGTAPMLGHNWRYLENIDQARLDALVKGIKDGSVAPPSRKPAQPPTPGPTTADLIGQGALK